MSTRESLILRLSPDDPAQVAWQAVDRLGHAAGAEGAGDLREAAAVVHGRDVVVLVPTEELVITHARVPAKRRQQMLQALPYALEEHLSEDVERLHFAVGERREGGVDCAVVSHSLMQTWLDALHAVGIDPVAMVPDALALPVPATGAVGLLEPGRLLLRTGPGRSEQGLAVDVSALQALEPDTGAGTRLEVFLDPTASESDRAAVEAWALDHGLELTAARTERSALALLAPGAAEAPIDLLQGRYTTRHGKTVARRGPWRLAASLTLAALCLELGLQLADRIRLGAELAAVDREIAAVCRAALDPAVCDRAYGSEVVFLQRAAERGDTDGGADPTRTLLRTLDGLRAGLTQAPDSRLRGISYRGGDLDVRLSAGDVQVLEAIRRTAADQGLEVRLQGVNSRTGGVEARMLLRETGP